MTLGTVDIGGNDYNVYASVAEADLYLAADPGRSTTWAAYTEDQKEQGLVQATRYLDSFTWRGNLTDETTPQATEWPRANLTDKNGLTVNSATVPQEIEDATIILAYEFLGDTSLSDSFDTSSNVKRVKAGSVEIENFRSQSGSAFSVETVFPLVGLWLAGNYADAILALASGTDVATGTGKLYERTEGFP